MPYCCVMADTKKTKTIVVDYDVYKQLQKLKVVDREPFNDVIKRLLKG